MTTKKRRIMIVSIIVAVAVLLTAAGIFMLYRYISAFEKHSHRASYYAEMLHFSAGDAFELISYSELSEEYRSLISVEEYHDTDTPEKQLALLKKLGDITGDRPLSTDIELSTSGYKKDAYDIFFEVGDRIYTVSQRIDIALDPLTLDTEIVRWAVDITEN